MRIPLAISPFEKPRENVSRCRSPESEPLRTGIIERLESELRELRDFVARLRTGFCWRISDYTCPHLGRGLDYPSRLKLSQPACIGPKQSPSSLDLIVPDSFRERGKKERADPFSGVAQLRTISHHSTGAACRISRRDHRANRQRRTTCLASRSQDQAARRQGVH
jgi:hypothetical protein